jgi:hypothetical protein
MIQYHIILTIYHFPFIKTNMKVFDFILVHLLVI